VSLYLVGFKVQTIENEENIMGKLRDIDGWLRNRLRYCIWYDWKNCSEAKITNTKKVIKKH
jgi:hypothetical protein